MRDMYKEFEVSHKEGETVVTEQYRSVLFDAFTGAKISKFVLAKIVPVFSAMAGNEENGGKQKDAEEKQKDLEAATASMLDMLANTLMSIDDDELEMVMTRCLNSAEKRLAARWVRCMDGKGWSVDGLKYDTMTCLKIVAQVIIHNFSDFFGENGLDLNQLMQNLPKLNP